MKLLKDYPQGQWIPAADACQSCGAPKEVRVTYVDDSGRAGSVEIRAHHRKDCFESAGEMEEGDDIAAWNFFLPRIFIRNKAVSAYASWFYAFSDVSNISPCVNCWRLVTGVPLILFGPDQKNVQWEIHFCDDCVKLLGIDKMLTRSMA